MIIELIYILCGIAVLIASFGISRFGERENIVYARLHIAGVFDTACIIAMLAAGQPLIALTYFLLTPLVAHSVANARYYRR
jgi:energy-converting hydrogenase B subunit C